MRKLIFLSLWLLVGSCSKEQNIVSRYGIVIIPDSVVKMSVDSIYLRYNNTTTGNDPTYGAANVVHQITTVPNYQGTQMGANTGIVLKHDDWRFAVSTASNIWAMRLFYPLSTGITYVDSIQAHANYNQGFTYNPLTGNYYNLRNDSITIETAAGIFVKKLLFPTTQPNPGMVDYNYHTGKFVTSYDGDNTIRIWQEDYAAGTLTLSNSFTVANAGEGVTWNQNDGTILVNVAGVSPSYTGKILTYDTTGTLKGTFTFPFTTPNYGSLLEGLAFDHRTGLLYRNTDAFYHGGVDNGNITRSHNIYNLYDKELRFPGSIYWSKGKFSGTAATGNLNKAILTGSGTWISPIIDFGAYTMQHTTAAWAVYGNGTIEFRGSNSEPGTTANEELPRRYWDANQVDDGWGGGVTPSSWSSNAGTGSYRYMQIKITRP